jgi:hypothetical protein
MLTRIRIEVSDEDSAAATTEALDRYERAVSESEAARFGMEAATIRKDVLADRLGRDVTDEVIEYDASLPGYKGRRVVCFKRLDTRSENLKPPPKATECATSSSVTVKGPGFVARP